jgi:hypothetical protein
MVWIIEGDHLATKSSYIPIWDTKSLGNRQISAIIDQPHNPGIPGKGSDLSL